MAEMKTFYFALTGIFLLIILIFGGIMISENYDADEPEEVIAELYKAVDIAKERGDYSCCIEPACTMCYLGHWKFEKGTCHCDEAIMEGRDEDVCPECKSGLEEGLCKSAEGQGDCLLDEEIFGGK